MTDAVLRLDLPAARALHLHAQGLLRRPGRPAAPADVPEAVRRMGALQIDTIHVVARSPYLVLWSRLGDYDPCWLDEALAAGELFEYWSHEASFVPREHFGLYRHRMRDAASLGWKYRKSFMEKHADDAARLLEAIRERGPVRSADFARRDGRTGEGWWDWKPEKKLLEGLFTAGELMVARRERFQRVYDLRERVRPDWDDARDLPSEEEARRRLVLHAVRALGAARERRVADYFRMKRRDAEPVARRLAREGALLPVEVEGWEGPTYLHPDHLDAAREAAAGRLVPERTVLLSPFDPLVWDRDRAAETWGFDYRLECYTPAPKRRYGYFVLPILRRGALVGRLDAKAHRKTGEWEVKALHLEDGVAPDDGLAADLAGALVECAAWHGTPKVVVWRTEPRAFAKALRGAVREAARRA